MKPKFRLALGQINSTVGDLQGNTQKIVKTIRLAREAGADLVAVPNYPFTGIPRKISS
jgi:predicted amidohydrolase